MKVKVRPLIVSIAMFLFVACSGPTPSPSGDGGASDDGGSGDDVLRGEYSDEQIAEVDGQLAEILAGDVNDYRLIAFDLPVMMEGIDNQQFQLPLVNADNDVVFVDLPIVSIQLREDSLTEGVMRSDDGSVERVELLPEQNYQFGDCANESDESAYCGVLTIMDEERTMLSGLAIGEDIGMAFFEPVDLLLGTADYPGLHVVYNIANTENIQFGDGEEPELPSSMGRSVGLAMPMLEPATQSAIRATKVVLDGDVTFYQINTATVWSRQEAIFNTVQFLYGLAEPLSVEDGGNSATWGLSLKIKGMEVWISGGPSTTNGTALRDELVDPNYYLITPVNDDELHFFFVGYAVTGLLGKAGGIGSAAGGFGGAAGKNHAWGDARAGKSLKWKWVLMSHEMGHVIGGQHSDGETGCSTFFIFAKMCGVSIMAEGGAGVPDDRAPYFSDDNDANIVAVITSVLP